MSIVKRGKGSIAGLDADLLSINQAITAESTARVAATGDLTGLGTTEKGSIVGALNELHVGLGNLAAAAMTSEQVSSAIATAKLGEGTNYSVDTLAARDALPGLDLADRVFVADDGTGKWAIYKPSAITMGGAVSAWVMLSDQASLENSLSATAIKAAYESNPDTNAFTNALKAIVLESITRGALIQDLATSAPSTEAPSAAAVKAYADSVSGGGTPILESLVVAAGAITLGHVPRGGLAGILNFATVRYTDGNGVSYDAPLLATADTKVFTVSTDTAGQWDGNTVLVQYSY